MDTSLKADTIHGVQPMRIQEYLLDVSQVPENKNCNETLQPNCSVRHFRQDVIDNESTLRGLDRLITKSDFVTRPSLDDPKNDIQPNRSKILESFTPFESVSTREKRPSNVLSGVTIDRFENPLIPAQNLDTIIMTEQYRGGFQSRLNAKDCNIEKCGSMLKLKPGYGSRCSRT
jgi:hypothetical protein